MKRLLVFLTLAAFAVMPRAAAQGAQPVSACGALLPHAPVLVGMTDTAAYFPKLKGLRVAVLANHTAVARFCEPAQGKYAAEAERLPGVSAGEAGGFAGQGRVSAGSFAGGFRRRDDPSGRSAARPRIQCDGDLFARTRIPGNGRCGRACRKLGGRADGNPDSVALRRQYQTPLGRGDAVVRRAGGRYAGRRTAVLHLLYNDAPHDGCLCRIRPYGRRARPAQSQRASDRRAGARHEVQVGRRSLADSRAARAYDGRDRPDGRRRGVEPEMQAGCGLLPQLHPCDTLRASGRAVAQSADAACRLPLSVALPFRRDGRQSWARNRQAVRNLRPSRYEGVWILVYATADGRGQASAAGGTALLRRRPEPNARSTRRGRWD